MKSVLLLTLALSAGASAETRLGKPLTLKEPVSVDRILASPDKYVGKIVQVKGKATDVCRMMGCWMEIVDPASSKSIRIKVDDGVITFPKEAIGKNVVAEGKLAKITLTKEQALAQAKHEAEESGRKVAPAAITSGKTYYQIEGTGAVILE